jgi:hypothetical protein
MSEEEIEKMFKELTELRKSYRRSNPQVKERVKKALDYINMDFVSLYPSTVTMKFPSKQSRRMKKIKNIFND